jgi:hypothetical protein
VYISDVTTGEHLSVDGSTRLWELAFRQIRWFTRGWTLLELIAPISVEFFCSNGTKLGDKRSLERQIHEVTGISTTALQGTVLAAFSVVEPLSWAEKRQTKRDEDKVYSLLGILTFIHPWFMGKESKTRFIDCRKNSVTMEQSGIETKFPRLSFQGKNGQRLR